MLIEAILNVQPGALQSFLVAASTHTCDSDNHLSPMSQMRLFVVNIECYSQWLKAIGCSLGIQE